MRIACLHIPQLSLQCATRVDPALRGAPVVVVGARPDGAKTAGPVVLACSRAAWNLGARVGMLATAARALVHGDGELAVVSADAQLERETVRGLADALLALTPVVDLGGRVGAGGAHHAMYCEVPAKLRGASFGERLVHKLEALGLTGRIGIADDRFTAWVAAAQAAPPPQDAHTIHDEPCEVEDRVISVPRGGSAAFLAPRPLALLAISSEVQHMLEALGVRTLGEFAALPAPSVARPLEADYQALARGEGERHLPPIRPYAPEAPIREEIAVASTVRSGVIARDPHAPHQPSLAAAVGIVAERIALRLAGRGRGAARLEVIAVGPKGERVIPIVPVGGTRTRTSLEAMLVRPGHAADPVIAGAEGLADTLAEALRGDEPVWKLRVSVTGEAIAGSDVVDDADETAVPILDTLSVVLSNTGGAFDLGFSGGLPLVLTSTAPGPTAGVLRERREAHRRTRRGKQRRRESPSVVQPRLFKG